MNKIILYCYSTRNLNVNGFLKSKYKKGYLTNNFTMQPSSITFIISFCKNTKCFFQNRLNVLCFTPSTVTPVLRITKLHFC